MRNDGVEERERRGDRQIDRQRQNEVGDCQKEEEREGGRETEREREHI